MDVPVPQATQQGFNGLSQAQRGALAWELQDFVSAEFCLSWGRHRPDHCEQTKICAPQIIIYIYFLIESHGCCA